MIPTGRPTTGRPKKGSYREGRNRILTVRISEDELNKLERMAEMFYMTKSDLILQLIDEAWNEVVKL